MHKYTQVERNKKQPHAKKVFFCFAGISYIAGHISKRCRRMRSFTACAGAGRQGQSIDRREEREFQVGIQKRFQVRKGTFPTPVPKRNPGRKRLTNDQVQRDSTRASGPDDPLSCYNIFSAESNQIDIRSPRS